MYLVETDIGVWIAEPLELGTGNNRTNEAKSPSFHLGGRVSMSTDQLILLLAPEMPSTITSIDH